MQYEIIIFNDNQYSYNAEIKTLAEFKVVINNYLRNGWEPLGGINVSYCGSTVKYAQSVIKR